jgi:hypothetical protein
MLRSAAIADPAIEPKSVNTKTDNATNFFMMVVLSATSHLGMLSDFQYGGCARDHRSLIFLIFLAETGGSNSTQALQHKPRWIRSRVTRVDTRGPVPLTADRGDGLAPYRFHSICR